MPDQDTAPKKSDQNVSRGLRNALIYFLSFPRE